MSPTHTAARSFKTITGIALLTLLTIAVACGGSGLEPRYRDFSAQDATLELADLPDGWTILDSDELLASDPVLLKRPLSFQ